MSDSENVLARWARLKRKVDSAAQAERSQIPGAPASIEDSGDAAADPKPTSSAQEPEPLFDLTKLPSIESITAETDISAFLSSAVPADLRNAALRRAWIADPRIRDFMGLNDYDFDFHTPGAIPGFGPLEMTDELRREVANILGQVLPVAETSGGTPSEPTGSPVHAPAAADENVGEPPSRTSLLPDQHDDSAIAPAPVAEVEKVEVPADATLTRRSKEFVASQQNNTVAENLQIPARRSHGGALPK